MKVYIHILWFTKIIEMPFKPEEGELIYFSFDFQRDFLKEIAITILNNYDAYKDSGRKLLYEDMHDCFVDDYTDPIRLTLSGYDKVGSVYWDMDEKTNEFRYNIEIIESEPRDKVCCCSDNQYVDLLKLAAGIY